jgi:WD40 repeat protein
MFIDGCVTVVGDRLVTANKSWDIEVRLVHTPGQVEHTICMGDDERSKINGITPVPGHSELFVTGHDNGAVHLWDIEKGARACECMHECRRARATNCAT